MKGIWLRRAVAVLVAAVMGVVLLSAAAMADVKVWGKPGGNVKIAFKYRFNAGPQQVEQYWGNDPFGKIIVRLDSPAATSILYAWGWYAAGASGTHARCVGNVIAGGGAVADSNVVEDSLAVAVDRSTPGQVKLTPTGLLKNLRHVGVISAISNVTVAVYPDTTSANGYPNTTPIASGSVSFTNGETPSFSGFFGSGDFSAVTPISGGFQMTTLGNQETVSVPDANAAVVLVISDPYVSQPMPATSPLSLGLLALFLLGGATWIMMARRRESHA